jgi:hypothetical protein
MQRNNSNNSTKLNNKSSVYKTFCKVCQDAGKTDKEYTDHNVRDRTGKTVCPTLLAQECRNCYKHGHTFKYCPLTKKATEYKKPYEAPVKATQPKSKNVFMLLESDSDNEVEEEPVNEFPVLQQVQEKPKAEPLNYSRLINMTEHQTKEVFNKKVEVKQTLPKAIVQQPYQSQRGKLDWATAESDSEGDEEEEDYYPVAKQQQVKDDLSAW